ncbi:cation channel sperm-associated protein 1 [Phodopus roborovskii]|uniref:cation channel sperm-associated protein 1 n=1 Tax=Phodopus roborovskii TaxID=109678 RepID=UPI0021E4A952|nr:cation channel sperm-associated protein 1 [Phodopus roborovskii]
MRLIMKHIIPTPMHTICQAAVEPIILLSSITNQLITLVDPTIKMGPSISMSTQTKMALYCISPTTTSDPTSPHHLIPSTTMVGPLMNLTPKLSPSNVVSPSTIADSTVMEGPIELVKLCPTSLLDHAAKGMLPSMGNPIMVLHPTNKYTTMAGFNILNPTTNKGSLNLERTLLPTPLRSPTTREELMFVVAIKLPIIVVSIPTTESAIITENAAVASVLTTKSIPTITFGAPHNSPSHTSPTVHLESPLLTKSQPKESTKESDSWSDTEQIQKRKISDLLTGTQRAHKKQHSGNIFQWIWEKISNVIWGLRKMMMSLTQSLGFETFIFIVVCLNTIVLVAQTFTELEIRGEWYFMVLDSIFLSIYVLEAVLKLIALGMEYFYDPWNNLDFFIMVMAVLDFVLLQINSLSYSFYNHSLFRILKVFKSMRALRAIRVLRRLSILTSLHEVTGTLSKSLPSITAILTLMFTCLFLFSVVLRALFRKSDPKRFQNIFTTLFTLFTMLTLDDWSLIYMDSRAQGAWYIIPILMIYIIIQYFIFLNLVIAVLVDNFQMALLKGLEKVKLEKAARVHEKLLDDSLTELSKTDAEAQMSEGALQMQFIERMFSTMTEKQRELHFQFLQLVAAVEQQQQKFRSQASVIDEIVDTAFEAGEEDFGK